MASSAKAIAAKMSGKSKAPVYEVEVEGDEDDAAGEESAMADFMAAVKGGDPATALAAYKDLKAICG